MTMATSVTGNNDTDVASAVIAADFTQGYFYKLVNDTLGALCSDSKMTSFLMDHQGYLITHTNMKYAQLRSQPLHITHLEQELKSRTIQRVYNINLDYSGVVESREVNCSKYRLERERERATSI